MEPISREQEVTQLHNYQEKDLSQLEKQLEALDAEIAVAEDNVAYTTNLLSAARGLVGMRGGAVNYAQGEARKAGARSRPKQRIWNQKDGNIVIHEKEMKNQPWSEVHTCGMIFSAFQKRFEAPRQSFTGNAGNASILITEQGSKWTKFLKTLVPGSRLWVLYWFDRNSDHWRHFVRPPRAKGGWRVGLFATRSPNRPTPIGLSLAVVDDVDSQNMTIKVSGVDILDETPLLAVKPYDPETESHPEAKSGWLDEINKLQPLYYDEMENDQDEQRIVSLSEEAKDRLNFISQRSSVDILNLVQESLKRVSFTTGEKELENFPKEDQTLAVGTFRIFYRMISESNAIVVTSVMSGMRREICLEEFTCDPEARLHLEFQDVYQNEAKQDL